MKTLDSGIAAVTLLFLAMTFSAFSLAAAEIPAALVVSETELPEADQERKADSAPDRIPAEAQPSTAGPTTTGMGAFTEKTGHESEMQEAPWEPAPEELPYESGMEKIVPEAREISGEDLSATVPGKAGSDLPKFPKDMFDPEEMQETPWKMTSETAAEIPPSESAKSGGEEGKTAGRRVEDREVMAEPEEIEPEPIAAVTQTPEDPGEHAPASTIEPLPVEAAEKQDELETEVVTGEKIYEMPSDLRDDYDEIANAENDESTKAQNFGSEEIPESPGFQVTLPGTPQVPAPPYDPYVRADMPDTLLNGEAPLYEGGIILRNEIFGKNHSIELDIPAVPEDVFEYYKAAMTSKGWMKGMSMKEKERGLLFFSRGDEELVFRIERRENSTRVTINMVGKEDFKVNRNRHYLP